MKKLLNTLFVTSQDVYLGLDGKNVVGYREKKIAGRFSLHTLASIVTFSYSGASPVLMAACVENNIGLAFCSPHGRFLARIGGLRYGNVLLRRDQYRMADDPESSLSVVKNMI